MHPTGFLVLDAPQPKRKMVPSSGFSSPGLASHRNSKGRLLPLHTRSLGFFGDLNKGFYSLLGPKLCPPEIPMLESEPPLGLDLDWGV